MGYHGGMLICIGGFPGSGRNRLSEALASALDFHYFRLAPFKQHPLFMREHILLHKGGTAYSDELLLRIYKHVVSHFRQLSKMYPDMIIKDHFMREVPREFLFTEAEKYFGPPLIIWTESSQEESTSRLHEVLDTKKRKLETRLKIQDDIRARFEPFTRPVHSVQYINNSAALDQALNLVREHRGF